jgi:hypothetical protein
MNASLKAAYLTPPLLRKERGQKPKPPPLSLNNLLDYFAGDSFVALCLPLPNNFLFGLS